MSKYPKRNCSFISQLGRYNTGELRLHVLKRWHHFRFVVEKLLGQTGYYNSESTSGNYKTLPIDESRFTETGMSARFPNDFDVLKKYIS